MSINRFKPYKHYPQRIAKLSNLEGGSMGTLDLTAKDPHSFELDFGEGFVTLSRRQSRELLLKWADAIEKAEKVAPENRGPHIDVIAAVVVEG